MQIGFKARQSLRDPMFNGAGLTGEPAPDDGTEDIVLALSRGHGKRLRDYHPKNSPSKIRFLRTVVNNKPTASRFYPHPCDRVLPFTGSIGPPIPIQFLRAGRRNKESPPGDGGDTDGDRVEIHTLPPLQFLRLKDPTSKRTGD
jgi:hypothetical protein